MFFSGCKIARKQNPSEPCLTLSEETKRRLLCALEARNFEEFGKALNDAQDKTKAVAQKDEALISRSMMFSHTKGNSLDTEIIETILPKCFEEDIELPDAAFENVVKICKKTSIPSSMHDEIANFKGSSKTLLLIRFMFASFCNDSSSACVHYISGLSPDMPPLHVVTSFTKLSAMLPYQKKLLEECTERALRLAKTSESLAVRCAAYFFIMNKVAPFVDEGDYIADAIADMKRVLLEPDALKRECWDGFKPEHIRAVMTVVLENGFYRFPFIPSLGPEQRSTDVEPFAARLRTTLGQKDLEGFVDRVLTVSPFVSIFLVFPSEKAFDKTKAQASAGPLTMRLSPAQERCLHANGVEVTYVENVHEHFEMSDLLRRYKWSELSHAYGVAANVPGMLDDIDFLQKGRLQGFLFSSAFHQGTLYPVTAPVVDVLSEAMISHPTLMQRREGLCLIITRFFFSCIGPLIESRVTIDGPLRTEHMAYQEYKETFEMIKRWIPRLMEKAREASHTVLVGLIQVAGIIADFDSEMLAQIVLDATQPAHVRGIAAYSYLLHMYPRYDTVRIVREELLETVISLANEHQPFAAMAVGRAAKLHILNATDYPELSAHYTSVTVFEGEIAEKYRPQSIFFGMDDSTLSFCLFTDEITQVRQKIEALCSAPSTQLMYRFVFFALESVGVSADSGSILNVIVNLPDSRGASRDAPAAPLPAFSQEDLDLEIPPDSPNTVTILRLVHDANELWMIYPNVMGFLAASVASHTVGNRGASRGCLARLLAALPEE
eukprot:gnl/Chilomastix_cuspidata/3357.p1 GENE.gnl/Chilomastix_cuspidata/3357~~gnl/Chilomastix_cuspidata/3357.p1  ORF type:complete len:778 (-),score=266.14 gnl/Chilomastix_cuspidata/3357:72-2405(-)